MGNFYQPQQQQNPLAGILQALLSGQQGPQMGGAPLINHAFVPADTPNARDLAGMQAQTALQPGANAYGFVSAGRDPTQATALNPFGWLTQAAPGFQQQNNASGSRSFIPTAGNPGQIMANQMAPEQRANGFANNLMNGGILAPTTQLGGMMGGSTTQRRNPWEVR